MARQSGRPAQLGADDVIRFLDSEHFLRELAGNLGRGRAFVRTRREFVLQEAVSVQIEAPGVDWTVKAEAVVVFARDGFVGLEFENFEQTVLPELDRLGQDAEKMKGVRQEATVIAPIPSFDSGDIPLRAGAAEVHITEEEDEISSHLKMRPMPSIPEPAVTELEELRVAPDRGATLIEDPSGENGTEDLPDGTLDLGMYERPTRTKRHRNSSMHALDIDDAEATHDGTPLEDTDSRRDAYPAELSPIAMEGIAVFEDRERQFVRATPGGVLKLQDEGDVLGLYLSQVRHGLLMAIGGPDGEVGETVRIKVAAGRVVSAEAKVLARVGEIVTLAIADEAPFRELLRENRDALFKLLESLVGGMAPAAVAIAMEPAPPPPQVIAPPPRQVSQASAQPRANAGTPTPSIAPSIPASIAPATPPPVAIEPQPIAFPERTPPPAPPPEPAAAAPTEGPPRAPKLVGNLVRFDRILDLAQELKANLANGGLFVESSPLPLRTKQKLSIAVGDSELGCIVEGEVVFADGGRVGFMVAHAQDVVTKLQHVVTTGELPDADGGSIDLDQQSLAEAAKAGTADHGADIRGRLDAPLTMGRILDLQFRRIDNEAELAESTMLQLFEFLVRKGWRGVLEVEADEKKKLSVWLHEASVAFVMMKPMDETFALGRILINMKRLNEAHLRQGLETARQTKKSLGRTLVSLGLIKKADLSAALREQSRVVLHNAFSFKAGRFEWGQWREPPGEADLVLTKGQNVMAHHLRHRYEELGSSEIEVLFGKNMGRRVFPVEDLDRIAGPIALQPKELRFLQLQCDGSRTISDAVLGSPIGRLASLRLVGVLLSMGQLRFADGQHQSINRENTSMAREPSAFVRIKKELRERLALLRGMNHFEVLGVHWSAHHRGHKAAYDKIKREFDLKKSPLREAPEDVKTLAKEINGIIDSAWTVLSNAETRQSYRKQLFDKTERQYASEMLVKQGEVALMRGDRVAAIEALETAVELEPSNRNKTLLSSAREGRR